MSVPGFNRPSFIPSVAYRDNRAALKWLEAAFGFEPSEVLTDGDGKIIHAEMTYGDGVVMIGSEWEDWTRSPASLDGKNTQRVHVRVNKGIDEHFARACKAGANVVMEPADQFYGDRSYVVTDPEGHYWTFAQTVKEIPKEELERSTGLKFNKLK